MKKKCVKCIKCTKGKMSYRDKDGNPVFTIQYIAGLCMALCGYCFSNSKLLGDDVPVSKKAIRLIPGDFLKDMGEGITVFVTSCNDLFAPCIRTEWIVKAFGHMLAFPKNTYWLQTKFVARFIELIAAGVKFPVNVVLITTLETNRYYPEMYGKKCPTPEERYTLFKSITGFRKAISIDPIMDFDMEIFVEWIISCNPEFVYIGEDTRGTTGLITPSRDKIKELIYRLQRAGIDVKLFDNYERQLYGN